MTETEHTEPDTPKLPKALAPRRHVTVRATDKTMMILEQDGQVMNGTCPKCLRAVSYPAPIIRGAHVECPRTGAACGWAGWAQ